MGYLLEYGSISMEFLLDFYCLVFAMWSDSYGVSIGFLWGFHPITCILWGIHLITSDVFIGIHSLEF